MSSVPGCLRCEMSSFSVYLRFEVSLCLCVVSSVPVCVVSSVPTCVVSRVPVYLRCQAFLKM